MGSWHAGSGGASGEVPPARLLDRVRWRARRLGLSIRTEDAYVGWIRRFILANAKRHPATLGAREVEAFLTWLAASRNVAASTQNQALAALLFLYREVLNQDLPWMENIRRAKKPVRLPVVLTREEVGRLLEQLQGQHWLMASLLYGSGLRLMECVRLRVKDIDVARGEIIVRHGKGGKDRRTACIRAIWAPGSVRCGCRMRWRVSFPARRASGPGSTCFRRVRAAWIHAAVSNADIMWTKSCCSARCIGRCARRVSTSRPVAIPCDTVLPRI